jgi:Ca2+-binding RTX toxin-like protein
VLAWSPKITPGGESYGGAGQDVLSGGADGDFILGEGDAGNDRLFGGPERGGLKRFLGNDQLFGEEGDDFFLVGGPDHDLLGGGPGNDNLLGNEGADTLSDCQGSNQVDGGPGHDVYRADQTQSTIGSCETINICS